MHCNEKMYKKTFVFCSNTAEVTTSTREKKGEMEN